MKTLVIIPVNNVESTILQVIDDLKSNASMVDYLIVDYGSNDRTIELLDNNQIPYLSMPLSSKYKYALNVGMQYAKHQGYDGIIEYDGQNLYQAKYIPDLLNKAKDSDLVLGTRFLIPEYRKKKKIICRFVSFSIRLTTKQSVSDPTMRYRFYNIKVVDPLLRDKYFKSGPDAIAYLIASNYTFNEMSMELRYNPKNKHYSQSNVLRHRRLIQGIKWIISILLVQPFRKRI